MKKLNLLFTALLLMCCVGNAKAVEVTINGIEYNVYTDTKQAKVIDCDWDISGDIVIPSGITYNNVTCNVTSIGDYAFRNCSGLTSITIPNSVTSIGIDAFSLCSGLTSITIPNSVTSIGIDAFEGCTGLESIVVDAGNTKYDSRENCNAIIETESNTLITGCKNTVIPNSVTSIGRYAFYKCSGLTSITIPNSVTSIGNSAFWGCSGLTSITIPNSVTSIGNLAFYKCSGLTSITIPNSVTSIGEYAFNDCFGLKSVIIGNSVTSIGQNAFAGCSGLKEVHINDIAAWCSIDFEGSGGNPLYYAHNLYLNNELITELVIPNGVTSIKNRAFDGCSGLTSITIPYSVTSIGYGAFAACSGLKSITIPNSVTSIGDNVFSGCSGLSSVTIGNSVTSIGYGAFYKCSGLTSIVIPNSVTSIGDCAFDDCKGLTSVTIGNSVTSIGEYAFYSCSKLTSITIPNSVTSIGERAFYACSKLKTVYNYSNLTFKKGSTDYGYVAYYADIVTVPVEFDNNKLYYISTDRGSWAVESGGSVLNSNRELGILADQSDSRQLFAIFSEEGKHYIYHYAEKKYINKDRSLGDTPVDAVYFLKGKFSNTFVLCFDKTHYVNITGNGELKIDSWTTADEGNSCTILAVAKMAPLENAIANAESVLETRAQLLTDDEKKAISAAVQTAKDEKGNTNADVIAEIARLTALSEMVNNAVGDAIYVNAIDEISNAVCYTVSTESRGAWYSEASNLNSTGKLNIAYNITDNKQQFAFIKSPKTGNYYLYSVSEAKFVSKNGDYTTLTETPVQTITFLTGERTASYPWIIALNTADGEKQIAVSNTYEYGIITFYNDLTDAGNTVRLEMVATFDATAALALIYAYENGKTAIEEVNVENVNVIIYDLQGRRVKEITEGGIYIINGKKVLVK